MEGGEEIGRLSFDDPFLQEFAVAFKNLQIPNVNDVKEVIMEFVRAVDWDEPWLISLGGFHISIFFLLLIFKKYTNFQIGMFFGLMVLALLSETFNQYGSDHWKSFSRQDYFDKGGLFFTVVYSTPILFNAFVCLMIIVAHTFSMLIQVKVLQLKEQKKQKKQKEK